MHSTSDHDLPTTDVNDDITNGNMSFTNTGIPFERTSIVPTKTSSQQLEELTSESSLENKLKEKDEEGKIFYSTLEPDQVSSPEMASLSSMQSTSDSNLEYQMNSTDPAPPVTSIPGENKIYNLGINADHIFKFSIGIIFLTFLILSALKL